MDKVLISFDVSKSVAVSSFIKFKKTKANAAATPGNMAGSVKVRKKYRKGFAQDFVRLFQFDRKVALKTLLM